MGDAPPRIVGYFDGVDGSRAVGWAANLDAPDRAVDVEFLRDEPDGRITVLGRVPADRPRDDLRAVGFRDIRHGFAWELPPLTGNWQLRARVAGCDADLPGGSVEIGPDQQKTRIVGQLDAVEDDHAVGWAADLGAPDRILDIEFFDVTPGRRPTLLGRTRANRERRDLRAIGLEKTRHGFAWRLPGARGGLLLSAKVAGHEQELPGGPIPVAPAERAARIIGRLDAVRGSRALGWAADPDDPQRVLEIEFFDGAPGREPILLGRARANRPRDDLRRMRLRTIRHGFDWRIPFRREGSLLSARVAGHDVELAGSPATVLARPVYEGSFDGVVRGVLRGWAWAWDPAIDVNVEVFVDGKRRGVAPARTERPDLAVAGIGDGRHGFAWIVPIDLADGAPHEFACRVAGTEEWLDGSPQTAAIAPGGRLPSLTSTAEMRGVAPRPRSATEAPAPMRFPAIPPTIAAVPRANLPASSTAPGRHAVKLLVPVWGEDYIAAFCRTVLPAFLSPNNLPFMIAQHALTITFLTRTSERHLFLASPAFQRLCTLAGVEFLAIDDILAACFDPAPDAYATALTYAFHRGIRSAGSAALATDFVFWDADFVPADGLFRTLAGLISAGVRCTFAPSLRVDPAAEAAIPAGCRSGDGSILDMGPRDWIALAMRFLHPTVKAQTVNLFEERMIDTVNQLYWRIDDGLLVARVFLMFMLHIRPERLYDEIYGHCDYVFVPEMVPSGDYHLETESDRMLIIELQHRNRERQEIVYGDAAMTPSEVARGVARWTTREHRMASRSMVVFNAGDPPADLAAIRRTTDDFMTVVYRQMPADPVWHNGHLFWTDSLAALGLDYGEPGPEHPRSHLAAALRWTGYDIDVLRESWPDPAGPPRGLFDLPLPLDPAFDLRAWLETVQSRYRRAWREAPGRSPTGQARINLLAGHFHGFGWGLVERHAAGWVRRLGPDGRATLLLRVPPNRGVRARLLGADERQRQPLMLGVCVNGHAVQPRAAGDGLSVCVDIDAGVTGAARGCLEILLDADRAADDRQPGPGIASIEAVVTP